jgi:hypothetical protein
VGVAAQLPAEVGDALITAAREAFTQGMQFAVVLSAVVAAGIAILSTVLLRAVPAGSQAEAGEQPAPEPVPVPVAAPEEAFQAIPEESFQVIRVGSGCLACPPGERRPSDVESA